MTLYPLLALCLLLHSSVGQTRRRDDQHAAQRSPTQHWNDAQRLSGSNINFTTSLYHLITKQQTGNVFFSPLSIHAILTMTSLGAKGTTLHQFNQVLSLPSDVTTTRNGYKQLIQDLNSMKANGVTVNLANKIFVSSSYHLNQRFKKKTKETFRSEVETINYRASAEARQIINSWVAQNTNNTIKNVISEGSISADTSMILVNAVHFKGTWRTKFDPEVTRKLKFYVKPDKPVEVDMMYASGEFFFRQDMDLDAKILNLHYKNDQLSMILILPKTIDGLATLESKLTPEVIANIFPRERQSFDVDVYLPKFKFEESTELREILIKMGMTSMFSNSANLTGILNGGQGLKVSDVAHKSFIEVNEEGTEAAAATIMWVQPLSAPSNDILEFKADHPFIFLVRHNELKHVLFMGRYVAPSTLEQN